jgi:cell division protein FtsB
LDTFVRYILPALISTLAALVGIWASVRIQTRRIASDTDAVLLTSLMKERVQLTHEIDNLKVRCDTLEEQNREEGEELVKLHEQNRALIAEIKRFGAGLQDE